MIAVVCVSGVETSRALQTREFRSFTEHGCDKQPPRQNYIDQAQRCPRANDESFPPSRIEDVFPSCPTGSATTNPTRIVPYALLGDASAVSSVSAILFIVTVRFVVAIVPGIFALVFVVVVVIGRAQIDCIQQARQRPSH